MKLCYLKNSVTKEICDVLADSLENAIERACHILGGKYDEWYERFGKKEMQIKN